MAKECRNVIVDIDLLKGKHLDSSMMNQLDNARTQLEPVALFLAKLEEVYPDNVISTQLEALFLEAHGGFSEILSHMDQRCMCYTIRMMIPMPLRSTSRMISEVLKIIKLENIADRIKASKPSRSSCLITIDMVEFVEILLDCVQDRSRLQVVLQEKLRYLQAFFKLTAKRCIGYECIKGFFSHVEDVAYTALQLYFLAAAYYMEKDDNQARVLNCECPKLLERIISFKSEFRQFYLSVLIESKSSRSETTMSVKYMSYFIKGLRGDLPLKDQLSCDASMKVAFDRLEKGLLHLSMFLLDIEFKHTPLEEFNSLQSYIEALAVEAAIAIYSPYEEDLFFLLHLKLNHAKVEIDVIQLLKREATIIAPLVDRIDYVREELTFLRTFLMDLEQCKDHSKITDILTLIQSVTSQAWSFIDSASHHLVCGLNRCHLQLLLTFKFIKAAIRQMCPNFSTSSILDHPTVNLLNFLPINFEVIDSYSSQILSLDSLKMEEVLMGFHYYILDNMLLRMKLKDETDLKLTVASEVTRFYYGLLLLVTYLIDPIVQYTECKKQNNFLTGVGAFAIEAESAICLYEDDVDSSRCTKVNLVLQFLTISFKLIESEENLTDLLKHKSTLKDRALDLIESAHEEIIFLRAFLMDVLRQHTELTKLHDLLVHAEVTAPKLAKISGSCYESFMKGSSTENMTLLLSDLLQEIESVKVEFRKLCFQVLDASPCNMTDGLISFLLNHQDRVLNLDACSTSFLKNHIPVLKEKLAYLASFLEDVVQYRDMHQEFKDLLKRVQDMKYAFFFSAGGYRPAWYYVLYLSDVKQMLRFIEAEVKMICLKVPDSSVYSFPKTNGLGFLNYFLSKLEELLHSKLDLVIDLKHQIGSIKEGLLYLRSLSDHFAESCNEHDEVYSLVSSVTEVAYKAEYVIDSCLTCSHPLWYKVLWISEVVEDIKLVTNVIRETCERKKIDVIVSMAAIASTYLLPSLSINTLRASKEMEGFQDVMNKLKKQLLVGSPQLDVISIVGMPGLGKTTLAKKIYNDPSVTSHFDVCAQCRVTEVYSWKELLLTILNSVLEPADRHEKEDGELAGELRRFLLTKRFLILIDDVWDDKTWDNLHTCFKDARNGSRVVLTTQLSNVANYAKCDSEPNYLRLFRDDESWALLQKEVFQGKSCPPGLVDVGFQIAKSCRGLPLFIVLVAGVLKEKKMNAESWKEIEESLGLLKIGSLEESMPIIEFNYKNLPHQLKPCFLYFGGLMKGKDIHVSKLIRLWVAEGFIQENRGKAPEDVAEGFLEDLISRNLVMGVEKRSNGKLKTCRIHDMLHKFCLEKAKEENFLLRINRFSGEDTFPEKPKEYRLFVHSYEDQIDLWQPSRSNVRTLLFNVIDPDNLLPRDISFIYESFKLVKVLNLESFNIGGTFPCEIQSLTHLRYFAAQTGGNSIPSSVAKLWNLETFVVRGLGGEVILPSSLLKMVKLRHMHVNHRASFSLHENMVESLADSQLDNLETFSTPHLSYGEDTEMILRKMPKLRKMSCIFSGTFGYSKLVMGRCVLFPRLEFLSNLESLKLVSNSYPAKLPHVFNFPSRLKELGLSKFRLPWSEISIIGELPHLEILKLHLRAFEGDRWEVKDSEFPNLKFLELDDINVAQWIVSDDSFPMLECLVLRKCKQLEKIPSHFDDVASLQSIEVSWCSWSVANSAQEIQTTRREVMANDAFTVTIQPLDWARRLSP